MNLTTVRRRLADRVPAAPRDRTTAVAGAFAAAAVAAVVLGAAGAVGLGVPLGSGAGSLAYGVAWLAPIAGLAAAAVAWPLWWSLVEDRETSTLFETAVVGLVVGVAVHPTTWLVYFGAGAAAAAAGAAPPGTADLAGPADVVATAATTTLTGLFVGGVVTILLSVGVAVVAASLRDAAGTV
jgi:hypothetical protein